MTRFAAILLALSVALPALAADGIDGFWREFFARPAAPKPDGREQRRIALGAALFRDTRLSGGGARSCATCHDPAQSFTDGRARGAALDGGDLSRNTPSLWNVGFGKTFYWDGRAGSLDEQAAIPITHPREMAGAWGHIVPTLKRDVALDVAFHQAFDERPAIQPATILAAIAAYERTLVSPPTRFDRWIGGDARALDAEEVEGFRLFVGRAGCVSCHAGWRFTDERFHDIGLASDDPGRGAIAGGVPGLMAFKTPSLREARWSGPYMHDGSKATFADVIEHYSGSFAKRSGVSSNIVRGLVLTADDRHRLIKFVNTLSSDARPVVLAPPQ